jgi:hypothetical protein
VAQSMSFHAHSAGAILSCIVYHCFLLPCSSLSPWLSLMLFRYIQVTHGNEALSSELAQLPNYTPPRPDDPLSGSGIFFPGGIKDGDIKVSLFFIQNVMYASWPSTHRLLPVIKVSLGGVWPT